VAVVAASIALSTWWFLNLVPDVGSRLDAVKTGLSVGAGTGAVVGFLVAMRRLRLSERIHAHTEHDALERRITDLYTKAADQLGSDKAPVRLAGLYALERLAQDNSQHRQTVVNLICAYLRMPYNPPSDMSEPPASTSDDPKVERIPDPREEHQVRLAAQRILTNHLGAHGDTAGLLSRPAPHWGDIRIDLTGATLIDFDLTNATVMDARFYGAKFIDAAVFRHVTFAGTTNFACATFSWLGSSFDRASFFGDVYFGDTSFGPGGADFHGATFCGDVRFGGVKIQLDGVDLTDAQVKDPAALLKWPAGWTVKSTDEDGSGRLARHPSASGGNDRASA
jgi:hypothetical protein